MRFNFYFVYVCDGLYIVLAEYGVTNVFYANFDEPTGFLLSQLCRDVDVLILCETWFSADTEGFGLRNWVDVCQCL